MLFRLVHVFRGMWELAQYGERAVDVGPDTPGMRFSDINREGTGMGTVWLIFAVEWGVFMVAAWYLEQVFSDAIGVRKHWLFPFRCRAAMPAVCMSQCVCT